MSSDSANGKFSGEAVVAGPATAEPEFVATCSRCHLPLSNRGSDGECLRCLVSFALLPDEDEASGPASDSFCYGHFEIALTADGTPVELGSGAMATTYRARDSVLHCDVALKVIDRKVAEHPAARARFLREARAAAKLHHPNVASVSHYGEQDGECYYAMELVDGETLEARVQNSGAMAPPLALKICGEITRALAAAEACKVVHRDLKPSNIMLTSHDAVVGVKVIDWGLAKAVTAEAALGVDCTFGGFVGTPAFASPEQFVQLEEQRVDTRSDIYSLGMTLWYLLCGRTPFVGHSLEEIHEKQVNRALPVDQLTATHVPPAVIALLRTMLAVDPGGRPQSARELLAAIESCEATLRLTRLWKKARLWLVAAAVLGLVLLAAAFVRAAAQRNRIAQAAADRSIAVLPFAHPGDEAADVLLAAAMQDLMNSELARVAQLKVIGATSANGYPPGERNLAKISRELGVSYLLQGNVLRSGSKALVAVALVNSNDGRKNWQKNYEGEADELFALERQITGDVLDRLRATLSVQEKLSLDQPPSSDPLAYDLYLRSRQVGHLFTGPAEMLAADRKKLALLEEAVARDPNFVLAYCEIAGIHDGLENIRAHLSPGDLSDDHRALAEMALARARRLKPDDGAVHLAQAMHLHLAVHDNQQARIEADLARRTLPNNDSVEELIALISRDEGRWDEALRAMKRAVELQPREPAFLDDLIRIYRAMRLYPQADEASERLLALKPEEEQFYTRLLRACGFLEGYANLEPLHNAIAEAAPRDKGETEALRTFRLIAALSAHDPDGITTALDNELPPRIVLFGNTYPKAWFEALAARMRGDQEGARKAFTLARSEMEQLVQARPSEPTLLSVLAMIDAGLARTEEAVREGEHAHEMLSVESSAVRGPVIACNLAVVYAWTNQFDRAIALLGDLATRAAGPGLTYQLTYGDLRLNPVWDPLRNDARFAALIERLAPRPVLPATHLQ